jgi:hypothetical protein
VSIASEEATTLRQAEPPHRRLTIPDHKELRKGTLRALIRQAGLSVDEFVALLEEQRNHKRLLTKTLRLCHRRVESPETRRVSK